MELETCQVVSPPPNALENARNVPPTLREAKWERICGAQCNQQHRRIHTFCTPGTLRGTAHLEGKEQGDAIKVVGSAMPCVNDQSPKERVPGYQAREQ